MFPTAISLEFLIIAIVPIIVLAAIFPLATLFLSLILNTLLTGVEYGLIYPRIIIFLVLFVSVCFRKIILKELINIPYHIKLVLFLFCFFVLWSFAIDIVAGLFDRNVSYILRKLSRTFLPIFIVLCTLSICNSLEKARKFLLFFLICASVSAFVALMQFLGFDFFWMLRTSQAKALGLVGQRVAGLANQAVTLSYMLVLAFPWALSFVASDDLRQKCRKSWMLVLLLILSLGTIVSLTRSAILGCILSGAYILWKFRGARTLLRMLPVVVVIILLLFFAGTEGFQRISKVDDASAQGRLPLAITGFFFSLKHPLGGGSFGNYDKSLKKQKDYYNAVKQFKGARSIFSISPHNHFINVLIYWGWPAFFVLLACLYLLSSASQGIIRDPNNKIACYGVAFKGMLIAYITNAFFHNGGPFLGDYLFWYFPGILGVVVAETKKTGWAPKAE